MTAGVVNMYHCLYLSTFTDTELQWVCKLCFDTYLIPTTIYVEQLEFIDSDMQYPNSTPDSINDIRWLIPTLIYPLNISFLSGGKYII